MCTFSLCNTCGGSNSCRSTCECNQLAGVREIIEIVAGLANREGTKIVCLAIPKRFESKISSPVSTNYGDINLVFED